MKVEKLLTLTGAAETTFNLQDVKFSFEFEIKYFPGTATQQKYLF